MIAAAIDSVACTSSAGRMFGRMCEQRDAPARVADGARGLDVVLDLDRHHLAARQAHEDRRRRDADRDHGVAEARAEEGRQRDREDQERAGQHRVGDAADQRVDPAADDSRPAARAARRCASAMPTEIDAGQQRGARAVDHAREHVAADLVGAEPVQRATAACAPSDQLCRDRIVGRDQRREHREQRRTTRSRRGPTIAPLRRQQPAPGAARRALQLVGDGSSIAPSVGDGHRRHALSRGLTRT